MELVFRDTKRAGRLDYVTAWYIKAARYMQDHSLYHSKTFSTPLIKTKTAFVSTNSIAQGEQVSILWNELFNAYKIKIHFAHRTFSWRNEARGNAAVHVVIIGFANFDVEEKYVYEYEDIRGTAHEVKVKNINPYLTEGRDIFIESRGNVIHGNAEMIKGSQPTDGSNLVLSLNEYERLLQEEPNAKKWIRLFYGSYEFINNQKRYCLWLKDIEPQELRSMPAILERIEKVKQARLNSPTPSVRAQAKHPHLFTQDRQPISNYLAIPEVSSINREYIPIGFLSSEIICSNKLQIIANATLFLYGILQSGMHMVWTRYVCGRLKSDFSYSPSVYNNFPFPLNPTPKQTAAVEVAAQTVLDTRALYPHASLADLYDPNTMPPPLVKAHQQLDKAVDACYRSQPFPSEGKRIEFLFELYDQYTAGLFPEKGEKDKR